MNYKLAKQLKDAGFPEPSVSPESKEGNLSWINGIYSPTLSELIEACDIENHLNGKLKGFFTSLEKATRDTWAACGRIPNGETCSECGRNEDLLVAENAKTPEEAVAKLWLKLNEN